MANHAHTLGDSTLQSTFNPIIKTISYNSEAEARKADLVFIQLDRTTVFITDSLSGVWTWDTTTREPQPLYDLVPYLPDAVGNTDSAIPLANCEVVPPGKFATWHRNRVFMCNPDTSNVWYSGTRTDLSTREVSARAIRPWELWNSDMDLARYNPGYGGAMVVGNPAQRITGMCSTENGLYIFKEQSIYLWNWPDSAAPHEVNNGANIRKLIDGVGCIFHKTIAQMGDIIYFVGRDGFNNVGLYQLNNGELTVLSKRIPHNMATVTDVEMKPFGALSEDYYYFAYDDGSDSVQLRNVYSITRGAWIDFTTPEISCIGSFPAASQMLVGTPGGHVLQFPSPWYNDYDEVTDENLEIPFKLRSRIVDDGSQSRDKKFRKVWNVMEADGEVDVATLLVFDEDIVQSSPPVMVLDPDTIRYVRWSFTNYFWDNTKDAWVAREPLKILGWVHGFATDPLGISSDNFRSVYLPPTQDGDMFIPNSQAELDGIVAVDTVPWVFTRPGVSADFEYDLVLGARPMFQMVWNWEDDNNTFALNLQIQIDLASKIAYAPSTNYNVFDLLQVEYSNNGRDWYPSSYVYYDESPNVRNITDVLHTDPLVDAITFTSLPPSYTVLDPGIPDDTVYDTIEGIQTIEVPTRQRAKSLQIVVSGMAFVRTAIHSIQAGWRERTEK